MEFWAGATPLAKTRSRKERWLLALLLLAQGRPTSRARLAQTLWPFPDHAADQAAYNLRRSLTDLRKALGAQAGRLVAPTNQTLAFDMAGVALDVADFDAAMARGDNESLIAAVALYRGPLLVECTETWAVVERTQREQAHLDALERLSAHALTARAYDDALHYLQQALAADPFRERAQRALMNALAQSGDTNAALHVYQQLSRRLQRERSAAPDAETTSLFQTLRARQRQPPRSSVAVSPDASPVLPSPVPRRLPVPLTTLVGREEQVHGIVARLQTTRLLTLTGSGGVGKTRLAIRVAEECGNGFADGVGWVDFSGLTDADLIAQTLAGALDVREEAGRSLLQTLTEALRVRQMLLIFDGCEHLSEACALLASTLLQACPALCLLATSRQPLGVSGESLWRVPSLPLPDVRRLPPDAGALPASLLDYAAIRLFVERAALVQPAFQLTPQNARAVAQICLRLDGIPLALELAAARVKALSLEQMARRLNQLFRLLTGGPHSALSRQQTMEAAIQWSVNLLNEQEKMFLARLSIFAGGWTLDAAETICADSLLADSGKAQGEEAKPEGTKIETDDVLELLARLVDKSLVSYEEPGAQARYTLLETVRQFGRQLLTERSRTIVLHRHLAYFVGLAREAEPALFGEDAEVWLDLLEREHDNLRAALEWALQAKDADKADEQGREEKERNGETALNLTGALWRFWYRRGYLSEGRAALQNALHQPPAGEPTEAWIRASIGAGFLALHQGDVAAAQQTFADSLDAARHRNAPELIASARHYQGYMAWYWDDHTGARIAYEEALAIQRTVGNRAEIAVALNHLGIVLGDLGEAEAANQRFDESLAIARALQNRALIASALHSQGHLALYQKDYAAARALYQEVLALAADTPDRTRMATALHRLGSVAQAEGDWQEAQQRYEASLSIGRSLAEKTLVAAALYGLGVTLRAQGQYAPAYHHLSECLHLHREQRDGRGLALTLEAFAYLAAVQGQAERAATLMGITLGARTRLLSAPVTPYAPPADTAMQDVCTLMGDAAFGQALARGQALPLDDALAYALHLPSAHALDCLPIEETVQGKSSTSGSR